jgi:hypothetical protein
LAEKDKGDWHAEREINEIGRQRKVLRNWQKKKDTYEIGRKSKIFRRLAGKERD